MPRFIDLDKELQFKIRQMENYANTEGKDSPECKALRNELGKSKLCCFALKNKDGVYSACMIQPSENSLEIHKTPRCKHHGGNAPAHDLLPEESKLARLKNLRPTASMIHGLYAEQSNFVESLTDGELEFMAWLDEQVRKQYDVEEGLGDVILEGLLHDAILHFRLLNSGRLERGSKHTAKPLQDLMKVCKDMGWTKKEQTHERRQESVVSKWLDKLDDFDFEEDDNSEDNNKPIIN
ncbi:hypothetical protein [Priestia aryabhattai]|uniref:hypothetical protein n=1 Tax=Priestia aryabhattai TaxID=412384 RepID=UPI000BFB8D16|nr:hypothetical protein [Priestia aryabhattai]PHF77494.1 hypothetical protein COI42_03635 [Priestia aryabhattai]